MVCGAVIESLYKKIENDLKGKIEAGIFASGKLPSERALLGEYGASRDTLRLAISNLVKQGLLLAVPRKGTFIKGSGSAALPGSRINIGILFLSRSKTPLHRLSCIFRGISNLSAKLKFNAEYLNVPEGSTESLKDEIGKKGIRLILLLQPVAIEFLRWALEKNIPVITLNYYYRQPDLKLSAVFPDHRKGGMLAAGHLLDTGCKKPGLLLDSIEEEYDNVRVSALVKEGYEKALNAAGIRLKEGFIKSGLWYRKSIGKEIEDLLKLGVDGIVCSSELVLEKFLEVLQEKRLIPGRDIQLVSLCEKDRIYPFPTVGLPYVEMGESAVMLANMILINNAVPQKIMLDITLRA